MGITLTQLRRAIGQSVGECIVGTIDAASTYSITDADLIDPDAPDSLFDHVWVRCYWEEDGGVLYDETRLTRITNTEIGIQAYDNASGSLMMGRAWPRVMPVGAQYEIHKLIQPDLLDSMILSAAKRCIREYVLELTPISSQVLYDLSEYSWLTRTKQVLRVLYISKPTDALNTTLESIRGWEVSQKVGGGLEFHIPRQITSAGDKLQLVCLRPYGDELDSDDGEDIPERWVKEGALAEVYEYLAHNGPAQDVERYARLAAMHAARFTEQSAIHAPRGRAFVRWPTPMRN